MRQSSDFREKIPGSECFHRRNSLVQPIKLQSIKITKFFVQIKQMKHNTNKLVNFRGASRLILLFPKMSSNESDSDDDSKSRIFTWDSHF